MAAEFSEATTSAPSGRTKVVSKSATTALGSSAKSVRNRAGVSSNSYPPAQAIRSGSKPSSWSRLAMLALSHLGGWSRSSRNHGSGV